MKEQDNMPRYMPEQPNLHLDKGLSAQLCHYSCRHKVKRTVLVQWNSPGIFAQIHLRQRWLLAYCRGQWQLLKNLADLLQGQVPVHYPAPSQTRWWPKACSKARLWSEVGIPAAMQVQEGRRHARVSALKSLSGGKDLILQELCFSVRTNIAPIYTIQHCGQHEAVLMQYRLYQILGLAYRVGYEIPLI